MKKIFAVTGALAGWFALILQLYISLSQADSRLFEFIKYISFMTIWTNFIVALTFTFQIKPTESNVSKFFQKPYVLGGVLVYIIVVALVYHLILRNVWNPQGPEKIADEFLHTVVPVFYLFYWIFFVPKGKLKFTESLHWLIYPLIYLLYTLIRGAFTGMYPYFFMDAGKLGYSVVFRNSGFITAGYVIIGILVILSDKYFFRKTEKIE